MGSGLIHDSAYIPTLETERSRFLSDCKSERRGAAVSCGVRILTSLALALTLALPAVAIQRGPSSLPSLGLPPDLERVLRDYETAWQARDGDALSLLFADNQVVMPNACAPVMGRAAVAACYRGAGGGLSLRAVAFGVDGALGYIIGEYAEKAGAPAIGRFTLTLRKSGERWLIVSDMDRSYPRQ